MPQLTQYELALLPRALVLIQQNPDISRDSLRRELACGADIAMRLLTHLRENDQVKIAERLQALPVAAEVRAETQFILGDTSGSSYSYVLRENARLQKALAKAKHKTEAEKEMRATEIRAEIEELKALAKQEIQRKPQAVKPRKDTDLMLEISTPDLHAGKLCWPLETGGAPYDVAIAIATFERAIEVLLERTKNFEFSEVLFCIGNDALNSDNPEGTTTSGTSVSNDGRFFRTFSRVRTMLVHTVERLLKIAPVRIVCCPGNHDSNSAYFLADSLECYFNADSRVVVENEPISRKYVRFGKCLIGFCHGHEERKEDLALLMASERPQDWSETLFREWHTGHYHKIQNQEFHGVRVRIIGALCSQDDWHSQKGYVNNLRTAQAFVWSKTEGLISEVFYNADAEEPITTRTEIV
jgi:hypothetical protein